jgi:glycosyltransferase involved in cell wall biosynthesis
MPTRLAIATPSRDQYSETFIAAHLKRLREVVLVLSGGVPPRTANGRGLLLPASPREKLRSFLEYKVQHLSEEVRRERRTADVLGRCGAQVLLAEYGHTGASLVEACRAADVPLVAHFHGRDAHAHQLAEAWGGYAALFAHAEALVVVSRAMEQRLLELGAPKGKLHYIPYGVDTSAFPPGDPAAAPPHFLAVGRFVGKKAPHLALMAFRKVAALRPEARLTMAGDGPLREACLQLVKVWGLERQVDLPGVQKSEWVAQAMRSSRGFLQHSVQAPDGDAEGTPLAVLEAMASGLPVVATRHAGIADVVAPGERGLLCAEFDVDVMADHLVQLIDDPGLAARMGRAGRAYVLAQHRVEDRVGDLQHLLEAVARRN